MKKYFLILVTLVLLGCTSEVDEPAMVGELPVPELPEVEFEEEFSLAEGNENYEAYLPIFMFHYIREMSPNDPDQLGYRLSVAPDRLEEFLVFFEENDIQTLTFWDLKKILEGKMEMPERAVILTFDDGHLDHYTNAYRLLEEYDMKGVFFVIANRPDNDGKYADWEQVVEMSDAGHEIGSHTVSHLDLTTLSRAEMESELVESKKILEDKIGKPVISLCYPAGRYDDEVIAVAEENYIFARTTQPGSEFAVKERYEMPNVRMYPTTGIGSLRSWFDIK